jgi:hypothetical protein
MKASDPVKAFGAVIGKALRPVRTGKPSCLSLFVSSGEREMSSYIFSIDKVEIMNCRSKGDHNDADWLSLILTKNDRTQKVGPFNIGTNIHRGDMLLGPWWIGPVDIADTDNVAITIIITNHSHLSDINAQRAEAVRVESAALGAVEAAAFGAIGVAVGIVMAGLGEVFGWILEHTNPNCNGDVGTHTFSYPPGVLANQGVPHTVTNDYTAESPSDCGNAPVTRVTYSVINPYALRQFGAIHRFDLSKGVRSFMLPRTTSLRAYMGMVLPDLTSAQ